MKENFAAFHRWFEGARRQFPWRQEGLTPYAVLVSEMMLQQTRAEVVVPYFSRWMQQFPTVEKLASASKEEVIKAWEGLGYYKRAFSLWQMAQRIAWDKKGVFPSTYEELLEIPGIGSYTAAALMSFAFHKKAAAVDGNVMRVVARLFGIDDEVEKTAVKKEITRLALDLLPEEKPWVFMEGLIELGALVCKKNPTCSICPFVSMCKAHALNLQRDIPKKRVKKKVEVLIRDVCIFHNQGCILVRKVPEAEVMAHLYEFPYQTRENGSKFSLEDGLFRDLGIEKTVCRGVLETVQHAFTRFRVRLIPSFWECSSMPVKEGFYWYPIEKLSSLPFSSGHRKILQQVQEILWLDPV